MFNRWTGLAWSRVTRCCLPLGHVLVQVSLDGQLQVEEFLQWVFAINKAEDEGADSLPLPDMQEQTLILAGCSRENFNGEYVKESGTLHNGRPVFYCAKNAKYLFYNSKRQQWQARRSMLLCCSLLLNCRVALLISLTSPPPIRAVFLSICTWFSQVFHDLGKLTSLCLKTQQGPQTAATWNVWDRKKKAGHDLEPMRQFKHFWKTTKRTVVSQIAVD